MSDTLGRKEAVPIEGDYIAFERALGNRVFPLRASLAVMHKAQTDVAPIGQMFLVANTTATVLVQDVWTKVAGTVETNQIEQKFSLDDNELVYDGDLEHVLRCECTFAITSSANNQTYECAIAVNGERDAHAIIPVVLTGSTASERVAVQRVFKFTTDDRITLMIRNTTSTANATVNSMQLTVGG